VPVLTSPLLRLPGAVDAATVPGAPVDAPGQPDEPDRVTGSVAAHYGDPIGEQRLLARGEALVDRSDRGIVTVSGRDRLSWLHSLTSQHLADLVPGVSAESLVLSPKGHIEHALHVVDDGDRVWITVEPGTAPALVTWLDSMRFMLRVEVADVSDAYAVLASFGDLPDLGVEPVAVWRDPWPGVEGGALVGDTTAYGPVEGHPGEGWSLAEVIVPRSSLADLAGRTDLRWAGTWALEALRVAAWRPRLGAETDHRTIAHEVDWLRTAVHLHKGCYRGQETIARVHNLGRPPRRLVFLHLDGSGHELPAPGAPVRLGERTVGHLTSVARHHEDGPIALALVKRNTDPAAVLLAGSDDDVVSAAQTVIVAP
jgi:tRNA-modifying protein YgfZ